MNDATESVNEFQKKTGSASKTVDDMSKATKRSATELLNQMKSMEGLGRSTSGYRRQLGEITKQIQDLSINYSKMSDEMKNSDFGREVAGQIQQMTNQAAEYRDAINDATQATRLLASDTANLDAAKSAIEGLGSAMQLVASAGILGEKNTEKVVKALAKLKAIESATNSVIKISNVLNKDSILMLKLKELWTKRQTVATNGATVAQKAFNTAAKKNIYVILISAIIAATAALIKYNKASVEARKRQEELAREAERVKQNFEEYKSAVVSSASSLVGKFRELQTQYKSLTTESAKLEWIDKNKKAFEDLGLSITTVNDANKMLVDNADAVIEALIAQAKAAGAYAMITTKSNDLLEAQMDKEQALIDARKKIHEGTRIFTTGGLPDILKEAGITADDLQYEWAGGQSGAGYWTVSKQAANKYYSYISKEQDKIIAQRQQEVELAEKLAQENEAVANSAAGMLNNNKTTPTTGNGGSQSTYDLNSIADYDAKIQQLNNDLHNRNLTEKETLDIQKELYRLEQQRAKLMESQEYAKIMVSPIPTLNPISTKKALEDAFKKEPVKIPAKLYFDENQYTFLDLNNGISDAISGFGQLNSAVSSVDNAISSMAQGWDENKTAIGNVTTQIGNMLTIMQSVCTVIDTMNKLSTIFDSLQAIGLNLEQQKNTEKKKGIILTMAESYQQARATGLSVVEAIATAIKSASEIPMVGWAIGLAAAASVIALIASAPKFAKGGIVPGSSFSGDKITAQVNSGEMILNRRQQAKLFDMLDSSSSVGNGGGRVEFVIKGQELKGVLNNYDKKMSRI